MPGPLRVIREGYGGTVSTVVTTPSAARDDGSAPDAADVGPSGPEGDPLAGLLPATVQSRARGTVGAAIAAAVALFDERGEEAVSVEAVRDRAGVTTGSIYHHFGDLHRLRAVALAVRSQRSIEGPVRTAVDRYRSVPTAAELARVTREQVVGRDAPEAREAVWALTDAIAAARDRPELRAVVSGIVRAGNDRMAAVLEEHRAAGRLGPDADPRVLVLLSRAFAHVRLLDDLDPTPVPHRDWVGVACRVHDGLVDPAPIGTCCTVAPARLPALLGTIASPDLTAPQDGDPRAARFVARARDLLVAGGPDLVQVARLRAEQGVSAGWFHRTFGDRAGLLAAARLDLLERMLRSDVASYARLVAAVTGPEELVGAVAGWVATPHGGQPAQRMRWQRADVLVAARRSPALRFEAGRAVSAATDEMVRITRDAQARGLIRPDLAPRAVARVAQALVFGPLLMEIDGGRFADEDVLVGVRRGLRTLVA